LLDSFFANSFFLSSFFRLKIVRFIYGKLLHFWGRLNSWNLGLSFINFFVIFYWITKRHLSVKCLNKIDWRGWRRPVLFVWPRCSKVYFQWYKNLWWRRLVLKNIITL
jgi:hypothetical protein